MPLDPDVAVIEIDLRSCLDHVYDHGLLREQLDYTQPPRLPLREPDATWARELLARATNLPSPHLENQR